MIRATSVDLNGLDEASDVSRVISAALAQAKVVHFRGQAFSDSSLQTWERIGAGVGHVMGNGEDSVSGFPNGNVWVDVRYLPEHQYTFRHSCTAQPLHTDDAYKTLENSSTYVLFVVEKAATDGGETYFVDAAELAGYLREKDPALLEKLVTIPVSFAKRVEGKTSTILKPVGDDWEVTWNYYNVDPNSSAQVLALREQFQDLLCSRDTYDRLAYGYQLGASEGAIWYDRKVLHGRTAFTASQPGDRVIWKCCIG